MCSVLTLWHFLERNDQEGKVCSYATMTGRDIEALETILPLVGPKPPCDHEFHDSNTCALCLKSAQEIAQMDCEHDFTASPECPKCGAIQPPNESRIP
jgi:hypothetical protein